ncbi:MAG: efflux RND transporter periplasmic adaptor subunit [Bacteriovorax sp.]|jgi:multidrug efflux pump subunit AcrA (membrane-fusion protein)
MRFYLIIVVAILCSSVWSQVDHTNHKPLVPAVKEEPRIPIDVPPEQQIRIGLKTTIVQKKALAHTIRTVGTVAADERNEAHVHSKLNGWIETIYADYVGKEVKKGGPLFDLYGPELVATQEEYISASKQSGIGQELARAALDRLKLWGVPQREIDKLKRTKKASRTISFESPVSGYVISKNAIQGMYITPGMELYQIADLSKVWIMVTLYEYDVAIIKVGDLAEVQLPYDAKLNFNAKISYISPEIEVETRTAKARIEVDNKSKNFKPGMYVNVILKKDLGQSIIIPEDAVLDTGLRKIVFVKSAPSRFEPREIKIGPRVENQFVILSGLSVGEEVVTSAHFFIDAESKLKASALKGTPTPSGHGGHK